jgi:hypothetical protein
MNIAISPRTSWGFLLYNTLPETNANVAKPPFVDHFPRAGEHEELHS